MALISVISIPLVYSMNTIHTLHEIIHKHDKSIDCMFLPQEQLGCCEITFFPPFSPSLDLLESKYVRI